MSNIIRNTASFALNIVKEYVKPGDVLVDATCGNGNDTLSLAKMSPSKLYAFDLQKEAIQQTKNRLEDENLSDKVVFIQDSHENIEKYISEPVKAFVFNLGYLPGSNKNITTNPSSTFKAVASCLKLLKRNGIIAITMYSGHPSGKEEKDKLLSFAETLDKGIYHCAYINMINQPNNPPEILLITLK